MNRKQSSIRKKSFIPHLPFSAFAVWMVNMKPGDATTILKQEDQFLHVKDGDAKDRKSLRLVGKDQMYSAVYAAGCP